MSRAVIELAYGDHVKAACMDTKAARKLSVRLCTVDW